MWNMLRNRSVQGMKFLRQFPIGPFIADFVCRELMLVVEVDGSQHVDDKAYDDRRTAFSTEAAIPCSGSGTMRYANISMACTT